MAFNLNALKGLFSKLKPAAKTVANYGDDVANAVANYGDDAMRFANSVDEHLKPYHRYDTIVQHGAVPNKLDRLLGTSKYSDVFEGKATHDGLFSLTPSNNGAIDYVDDAAKALTAYGDDVVRAADGANDLVRQSGLPATPAEWDDLTNSLNNLEIMDDIDNTLQFGKPITNFGNTGSYIDQMVSPTPNWTSRWGELEQYDPRLQNLYDQLRENFDNWTDFEYNFGFTPSHVDTGNLADQIIKLEHLRHLKRW